MKAIVLLADWDWTAPELPVHNWWFFLFVLIVLIIAIWLIARLTTSVNDDIDPAETDRQMLTAVSELRSQGELTSEEYRSIKSRLVDRLSDQNPSADSEDSSHKEQQSEVDEGEAHSTADISHGPTAETPNNNDKPSASLAEPNEDLDRRADQGG